MNISDILNQFKKNDIKNVVKSLKQFKSMIDISISDLKSSKKMKNFELRFFEDQEEVYDDTGSGIVTINKVLNSEQSVRSATILKSGFLTTNFDLVFENKSIDIDVPLLSFENLGKILDKKNIIQKRGGLLLVELDDKTEDVMIDSDYSHKVYLDSKLKPINGEDYDFNYIMFTNVEKGNSELSFKLSSDKVLSKLVHITENELFYEPNYYSEASDQFSIFEVNPLNHKKYEISVNANDIKLILNKSQIKSLNNNTLKVSTHKFPLGSRKYYELKHLSESIFIGKWNQSHVEVPSEDYMRLILDQFQINNLESNCMIQINLPSDKKIVGHSIYGRDGSGFMSVDSLSLDSDGLLYDDVGHNTKKIFVSGRSKGIVDVKLQFGDESEEYLKTFCSEDTYLIEQL